MSFDRNRTSYMTMRFECRGYRIASDLVRDGQEFCRVTDPYGGDPFEVYGREERARAVIDEMEADLAAAEDDED